MIMVYAFGYRGEYWWYKGFADAGINLSLGIEHTYGAGPMELGEVWYQSSWQGKTLKRICDDKRKSFDFILDNQHIVAGIFPLVLDDMKPNYSSLDFEQQMRSAALEDSKGAISVWLWTQGAFTQERLDKIQYPKNDSSEKYISILKRYSQRFTQGKNVNN
jgi:hypothetical protein